MTIQQTFTYNFLLMNIGTGESNGYTISTDKEKMNIDIIHEFLSNQPHWSRQIPVETVKKANENSLCFGVFYREEQVGFARVITDYATIAYLGDVFILPTHRRKGLSKWLMENVMQHSSLQGLRRWILLTADAHELYKKYGWKPVAMPERYMELYNSEVYKT